MGTVPDLNGIITTEVFTKGNDSLNEREKPRSRKKHIFRQGFPIIAIWVLIASENTQLSELSDISAVNSARCQQDRHGDEGVTDYKRTALKFP